MRTVQVYVSSNPKLVNTAALPPEEYSPLHLAVIFQKRDIAELLLGGVSLFLFDK